MRLGRSFVAPNAPKKPPSTQRRTGMPSCSKRAKMISKLPSIPRRCQVFFRTLLCQKQMSREEGNLLTTNANRSTRCSRSFSLGRMALSSRAHSRVKMAPSFRWINSKTSAGSISQLAMMELLSPPLVHRVLIQEQGMY